MGDPTAIWPICPRLSGCLAPVVVPGLCRVSCLLLPVAVGVSSPGCLGSWCATPPGVVYPHFCSCLVSAFPPSLLAVWLLTLLFFFPPHGYGVPLHLLLCVLFPFPLLVLLALAVTNNPRCSLQLSEGFAQRHLSHFAAGPVCPQDGLKPGNCLWQNFRDVIKQPKKKAPGLDKISPIFYKGFPRTSNGTKISVSASGG